MPIPRRLKYAPLVVMALLIGLSGALISIYVAKEPLSHRLWLDALGRAAGFILVALALDSFFAWAHRRWYSDEEPRPPDRGN
jgi:hypothetical protein